MFLLNPQEHTRVYPDAKSREIMLKTIRFFEDKGLTRLKDDDHERVWYADFLEFIGREKIFSTLLTPTELGGADCRWDTWRNCEFNEILGFYGLHYWYAWQVTILGLGPIWQSDNRALQEKTARLLAEGGIFGFGLSEKEHGADIYSTDMTLYPEGEAWRARGGKYYIGNGNEGALISMFGRVAGTEDYVFFVADPKHEKYECVRKLVNVQSYVAELALNDYPVAAGDILSRGPEAWDHALNTINVGKYNLGWASIGICTHAFYEAINHAANRRLYNKFVTDFPHVQRLFVDAYARLAAMKLFALRASDYQRVASPEDRRYLLFNPMVKMKVTMQGEEVINLIWDVIAAKGFEMDTYFEMASRDIRALPKLEGTAHVNMALIVKFMANYLFNPAEFPPVGQVDQPRHDEFLFRQGPTRGLGKIRFHDYAPVYESVNLPNVNIFKEQIALLKQAVMQAPPAKEQARDIDFLLTLGEIFTLVPYGQLILEGAAIHGISDDVVDQIFDFMVRDLSKYALELYLKPGSTPEQRGFALNMIKEPARDPERFARVWEDEVYALEGVYEMND